MWRKIYLNLLPVIAVAFTSCEKVIDIDLNDVEKKYVIEGVLTDEAGSATVLISQTKNFSDNNEFTGVTGAAVTISGSDGSTTALEEVQPGVYQSTALTGESGKKYSLSVETDGKTFTASATIPAKVNMDSLYITEDYLFGEIRKTANVQFKDPPGRGQSYRFIQYINGVKEKRIFIRNDDYTDGNSSLVKLRSPGDGDEEIKAGDTIKVQMLCIDPAVYNYWYSFLSGGASGDSNSASPANPVSNINGGALGYFSAHTLQTKEVVIQ
ncbi:MAG: DUF4249 domain-containing protein [Chitinophagaceae bacterium]|nr:DUF4249 domain-containing protein [Chitinophagaceae bacterium]